MRLEAIGYWAYPDADVELYPDPRKLVGTWDRGQRPAVLRYLERGSVFEAYRGFSFCRFDCGIDDRDMGSRDLFDGVWVWPEGLAHYVEFHSVRLPERFVQHVLAHGRQRMPSAPARREGLIDESGWLAWGREQGALGSPRPARGR